MDFFEPMVREGYEWINCVNQADYEVFVGFDGASRGATCRRASRTGLEQGLVGMTPASPRQLPNLRSQLLRKTWRPGAAGVHDDGLLELGQVPEHVEAALDGGDALFWLDTI